jgi:hypothetical protein
VKRLFRSRFHIDLSETAFGYSKISDLLQAPQFRDICDVELRGHGYVVRQKMPIVTSSPIWQGVQSNQSLKGSFSSDCEIGVVVGCRETVRLESFIQNAPVDAPSLAEPEDAPAEARWYLTPSADLSLSFDGQERIYRGAVQNTFIHFNKQPLTPSLPTSKSMPSIALKGTDVQCLSDDSTADSLGADESDSNSSNEEPHNPLKVMLNDGAPVDGASLLARTSIDSDGTPAGTRSTRSALRTPGNKKPEQRVNFCIDEPLLLEEELPSPHAAHTPVCVFPSTPCTPVGNVLDSSRQDEVESSIRHRLSAKEWPSFMSIDTLSKEGFVVTNTFLQAKTDLSTKYKMRSRSTDR